MILQFVPQLSIPLRDVIAVTKEKTALVIPNAIQVTTAAKEKHFFTSFAARDKAYNMVYKVWQINVREQVSGKWSLKLGLTSDFIVFNDSICNYHFSACLLESAVDP